jgi:formylglycine-generating enzyme required for sulfatase activity
MGEMRPVEGVSYDDVTLWKNGLNELSQRAEPQIQEKLVSLFPGHKLGAKYGRPTEAQWEYVARLGGFAESTFSFGPDENILGDYAIFNQNSNYLTQPVGSKKPVFYNGQPIYDLHGNVMVAMEDWFSSEIHGGVDPLGPNSGSKRVYRGGNWYSVSLFLKTNFRHSMKPNERASNAGFRLIRFF